MNEKLNKLHNKRIRTTLMIPFGIMLTMMGISIALLILEIAKTPSPIIVTLSVLVIVCPTGFLVVKIFLLRNILKKIKETG